MKNILFAIAVLTILSLSSCYLRVGESHPHRAAVIIHTSNNTNPKDSLQSSTSSNINNKDSLQSPVITEPVK